MVVAAVLGLGLGMAGGVMLGGQLFKLAEPRDYHFIDHDADHNENVPEPPTKLAVAPDVRGMLPYMPEWTTWPDFEQVRWLNSTLEWLWPSMTRAIHKMVDQMVGPILADLVKNQPLLDALTIDVFDLGPNAPSLGGVKVYDTRDDEVIIETPLLFGSAIKLHVSARVRIGPVSIYIPLKVEDITLKATARVTIRPLVETLPCLGAISISLTSSPYIDLVLKAINDWDLLSLPFLHDVVVLAVRKITEGICVYPNTIPIPLMPNSGLPKPPVGMLEVDIHKVENLKGSGDFFGKGDPYVRLSVIQINPKDGTILRQGTFHETKVQGGKKPVFNESKRLLLDEIGEGHEVLIEVFDWDLLAAPDLMCEYHLLLDDSEHSQFGFIKSPLNPEEVIVHLQPPAPKTGALSISNVSRMMSFSAAPKAGSSMGQLFLTLNYVPFFRPDDQVQDADNPAAALEAQQARAAPRKVNNDLKGVLTVNLTRCTDLPIVGGSCDSYVELKLTDPDSANSEPDTRKTELVMNETSPRFRQKFDFVYISATSTLTVTVFDKPGMLEVSSILKPFTKDDKMLGKVRIPVKDVVKAQRLKDAFPLQEAEQGDIHMTLEWQTVERDN